MAGAKGATNGHYEVREHSIGGLVSIVWCQPGALPTRLANFGEERLPLLATAIGEYLNRKAIEHAEARAEARADDLARRRQLKGEA
jgi:hypothetical protein